MNRILIVSNALSGGGAEAVARLMVQELNGATCILFENDAEIVVPGVRVLVASRKHNGGLLLTLLVNLKRLVFIQWIKIWLRPTVTISHLEGPNIANMLTVCGGRKVLFVHNHITKNYSGNSFREFMKQRLAGVLYRRADKIIGVSPGICKELCGYLRVNSKKVLFGPNPIDSFAILEQSNQPYPYNKISERCRKFDFYCKRILNKNPGLAKSLLPNTEFNTGCKKYDFYCKRTSKEKWLQYINQNKSLLGSS